MNGHRKKHVLSFGSLNSSEFCIFILLDQNPLSSLRKEDILLRIKATIKIVDTIISITDAMIGIVYTMFRIVDATNKFSILNNKLHLHDPL